MHEGTLARVECGGIRLLTDDALRSRAGIVVAFTERTGGSSLPPYASLNLAAHVGDAPPDVDRNRFALLDALGIGPLRDRLTMAEQVHGVAMRLVDETTAGSGSYAHSGHTAPVPGTDALLTSRPGIPLMLCFADCVPVILVTSGPVQAVAVVHAGWKGALGRLPGAVAERLATVAGCCTDELVAYVGPHVGACHYRVSPERVSGFVNTFGSIAAAQGGLDLSAVVSETLCEVGVPSTSQVISDLCTAERTDRFFSYRAEGVTGRHAAVACILGMPG